MEKAKYPATNGMIHKTLCRAGLSPLTAWNAVGEAISFLKRDHAGRPYIKIKGRRWLVTDRGRRLTPRAG